MVFAIVFPEGELEKFYLDTTLYVSALETLFPDLPEPTRALIQQELSSDKRQIANGGLCVWPSCLGSPSHGIVLVGDSGHGMWPSLGQGANCALESASVFVQVMHDSTLQDHSADWSSQVVTTFEERRGEDARAAVDLTYGGIGARKARGRGNTPLSFKLQVASIMLLHKLTCGIVPMPALLLVMMGKPVPYAKASKYHFNYEKRICVGSFLVLGGAVWWLFSR